MTTFVEASLNAQIIIRGFLIAEPEIISLVPAAHILDRHDRPEVFPSIILGADQVVDTTREISGIITRERVYSDLHIWVREPSFEGVKTIAGHVKRTLNRKKFAAPDSTFYAWMTVTGARFLRDPDGQTSHGVVTVETDMQHGWSVTL